MYSTATECQVNTHQARTHEHSKPQQEKNDKHWWVKGKGMTRVINLAFPPCPPRPRSPTSLFHFLDST